MAYNSFTEAFSKVLSYSLLTIFAGQVFAMTPSAETNIRLSGEYSTSGGLATYTLPIEVSPGRGGVQPELNFSYRSNGGNGLLGKGWRINGLSRIARCGQSRVIDGQWGGVNFDSSDRYCLDGERLIAVTGRDGGHHTEYRVEKNGYEKVISYGSVNGSPEYFKVWRKDGRVFEYGRNSNSRAKLLNNGTTYQWLIHTQTDLTGKNKLLYTYKELARSELPVISGIDYAGGRLAFKYETRRDEQFLYLADEKVYSRYRLDEVITYNSDDVVSGTYDLNYRSQSSTGPSLLEKIKYCGQSQGLKSCATPLTFDWQEHSITTFQDVEHTDYNSPLLFDVDGDGQSNLYGVISRHSHTGRVTVRDLENKVHSNLNDFSLTGSILSPVLKVNNGCAIDAAASYHDGNGTLVSYCRFSSCDNNSCLYESIGSKHGDFNGDGTNTLISGFSVADFDGDGRDDKYRFDIPSGDYRYELANGFSGKLPDPKGRVVKSLSDINRDGYLDVVSGPAKGEGKLYIHYFTGNKFSEPLEVALTVDGEDEIVLGDITGDGYPELTHKGKFYLNSNGRFKEKSGSHQGNNPITLESPIFDIGMEIYALRDVNGDGQIDILTRANKHSKVQIHYSTPLASNRIKSFNEYGVSYRIDYLPATDNSVYQMDETDNEVLKNFPFKQVTPQYPLVAKVTKKPKGYGETTYTYQYKGARSHLQGGGFLGFSSISETKKAAIVTKTVTDYQQSDLKLAGEPIRRQVFKATVAAPSSEQLITSAEYEYETQEFPGYKASYYQAYANNVTKLSFGNDASKFDKREVTVREVDRFGNIKSETTTYSSEHRGAGQYTQTTSYDYLSKGSNVSRFNYRIAEQSGGVSPAQLTQYPNGLIRYCTDNGETYFKPRDVFVFIGTPATPILGKRYDEYFKYQSKQIAHSSNGQSQFSGALVRTSKVQFDAANAYQCGEVAVKASSSSADVIMTSTASTSNEIITESPAHFWQLAAPVKETVTINDGRQSRVVENTMNYYASGLLKDKTTRANAYETLSTTIKSKYQSDSYQYDEFGNVSKVTTTGTGLQPRVESYTYKKGLYVETIKNAKGHITREDYDANGLLKKRVGALKQRTTSYDYDVFGRVTTEQLPGSGNTQEFTYQLGNQCPYATDRTVSCTITDAASGGKTITLYDYVGREVRRLHQGFNGQWVNSRTTWDLDGRKRSMTRPHFVRDSVNPPTVTFDYDLLNREVKKTEPSSDGGRAESSVVYDGLATKTTDPKGNSHISIVNVMGYVVEKREPQGAKQFYTYYPDGQLHTTTDSKGNVTIVNYDSLGHRNRLIDPDLGNWTYTHNALGELTYKKDANSVVTIIDYDVLGRKTKQKEGTQTSEWNYDLNGALGTLSQFSGRGQSTYYRYNSRGLTQEVSIKVGSETFSTHYSYDDYERLTKETRPNGSASDNANTLEVQYVFNPYGYLSAVRSPRNAADKEFSSAKFRGEIKQLLDQAIALANSYLNRAEKYAKQKDFYNNKAKTLRDGTINEHRLDRSSVAKVSGYHKMAQWCTDDGDCYLKPMGWVLIGNTPTIPVEAVIEGTVYRFNSNYQQTVSGTRVHDASLTEVDAQEIDALALNQVHDFIVKSESNNQASLFSSEDVYVASPDQSTKNELAYTAQDLDTAANLAADKQQHYTQLADKLVGLVEQVAVLSGLYCDDAKNLGGQHARMASRWGSCGTPTEVGQADHLQLVLNQSQLDASVASGTYLYYWQRKDTDAYDHTLSEVLGNGLTNDYSHNAATGRPDIISTRDGKQSIRELHYRYDDNNNVTYRNDLQLGITDTWKYDSLDRVINNSIALRDKNRHGVNNPDLKQAFTYQYDQIGNIKLKTGVGSYSYSGVNAGPHAVTKAGSLSYLYDSVGNLIRTKRDGSNASERTLTWTEFNKPASITRNGQLVQFYYDANHNRYLKKSSDGSETFYFGKTYERIKASDGEVQHKHFVYADGKLIALNTQTRDSENKLKNKQVRYLHYDALNSVDMITDGYGNVVERRSYDTWGKQRTVSWRSDNITEVIQSAITNRGYTGHEQIEEVGLIHMNGRVYDADLGRFLSADPHVQSPYITNSYNRYTYVMNNPLKYVDPTGFFFEEMKGAVSRGWENLKDFLGFGGNYNGSNGHTDLEGDGLEFTAGYMLRGLFGLVGGKGNTEYDQLKMGALTAKKNCDRGHCGFVQYSQIQSWNAYNNLMYSALNYGAQLNKPNHNIHFSIVKGDVYNIAYLDVNTINYSIAIQLRHDLLLNANTEVYENTGPGRLVADGPMTLANIAAFGFGIATMSPPGFLAAGYAGGSLYSTFTGDTHIVQSLTSDIASFMNYDNPGELGDSVNLGVGFVLSGPGMLGVFKHSAKAGDVVDVIGVGLTLDKEIDKNYE
ncbi:type IV secretion protein Rhs [Vibrio fortis]|uniref:Type IV secretion protein Rhs n=1 Tax=Vibrio fortis TaxID=212667 RepID=A0A5N3QVR2_9VIBR|nr:RHS repeat-associated core domain-containing protein [Vibrio fortis]KAB0285345.1 type IV secretion protein Rhs [Vibrio fortis]